MAAESGNRISSTEHVQHLLLTNGHRDVTPVVEAAHMSPSIAHNSVDIICSKAAPPIHLAAKLYAFRRTRCAHRRNCIRCIARQAFAKCRKVLVLGEHAVFHFGAFC